MKIMQMLDIRVNKRRFKTSTYITYIPTVKGWLYLALKIELRSHLNVEYSMDSYMK
jgi:hypothetical protein